MRDWSTMPPELLSLISQYLTTASDFIRFRSVCPCWRSAASHCALPPSLPCIAIPSSDDDDTDCKFTSLYDGTVHYRQSFPNYYHHKQFFGAAAGWVAVRRKDPFYSSISLLNPVTDAKIHLPPLEEAYRKDNTDLFFIQKITLSSPINDAAVSAVAIFCSNQPLNWKMALARPGAVAWTPVDSTSFRFSIDYHDAIFFCGRFYVVDRDGALYAFEDDLYPRLVLVVREWADLSVPTRNRRKRCYLAESAGELLMVERYFRRTGRNIVNKTKRFEVSRKDPSRDNSWEIVESLGNGSIFLGLNHPISICASMHRGCRENCIYFVDDTLYDMMELRYYNFDAGVFNLGDRRIKIHQGYSGEANAYVRPPLVWFPPSLV